MTSKDAEVTPTPSGSEPDQPQRSSAVWRWTRRLLKTVGWLFAVAAIAVVGAIIWLQTDHGKAFIRDTAVDLLNGEFQGSFEVERIEGSIISDITLVGVRIFAPDGTVAVDAERVSTDLHLMSLLSQEVHLSDIRVVNPRVVLFDKAQAVTFEQAFLPVTPTPSDPAAPAWHVRLEDIRLVKATVNVNTETDPLELTNADVNVDTFIVDEEGLLSWSGVTVNADAPAPYLLPVKVTAASGEMLADELKLSDTTVIAGPHRVTVNGSVTLPDVSRADVTITDLVVDLDALPEGFPALPLGGVATGNGAFEKTGEALSTELQLDTTAGKVHVLASADLVAEPFTYQGIVEFFDVRPGGLTLDVEEGSLPKAFVAQGSVKFEGVGNPVEGGTLAVDGSVTEVAPNPGGRLSFRVSNAGAEARVAGPGELAVFDVDMRARGVDVGRWLPAAGLAGLSASLNRLDLAGHLVLNEGGAPALAMQGDISVSAAGRLAGLDAGLDAALDVPELSGRVDLVWGGMGLPTGQMLLQGTELRFGQRQIGHLGLDLQVDHIADAYAVTGVINLTDAVPEPGVRLGQVQIPVDLTLKDTLDTAPSGRLGVGASDVAYGAARIARIDGKFKVRGAATGIHVTGPFEASGVRTATASARRVDGRFDGWVGFAGGLEGDAKVVLQGVRAQDVKAQKVTLTTTIAARRGLDREPKFTGTFDVQGLDAAGTARVGSAQGKFDVKLVGDFLQGHVEGSGQRLKIDSREVDRFTFKTNIEATGQVDFDVRAADGPLRLEVDGSAFLPVAGVKQMDVKVSNLTLTRIARQVGNRFVAEERLISAKDLHWQDGRWLEIDDLKFSALGPTGGQRLVVNGRIDPTRGLMDLRLVATDVRIKRWLNALETILETEVPLLPGVDGVISAEIVAKGTFADPELSVTLALREGALDNLSGMTALVTAKVAGRTVAGAIGVSWHSGGKLEARVDLPVKVSLSPLRFDWDEAREMDIQLNAQESDLKILQNWLAGLGTKAGTKLGETTLAGSARINARLRGPVSSPFGTIEASANELTMGRFKNGTFTLRATSHSGQSQVVAALNDDKGALLDLKAFLPFDSRELLTAPSMFEFVRDRLRAQESELTLKIDRREIRNTPIMVFLPADFELVELSSDLRITGTMQDPTIDGALSLSSFEYLGLDGGIALTFDTLAQSLRIGLIGTARGRQIVEGFAEVPKIGLLLTDFAAFDGVLLDPLTHIELFTAELTAPQLWDFSPTIGELATSFFPDGRGTVFVRARGAPEGPLANVAARIRVPKAQITTSVEVERNLAEEVWLNAQLDPKEARVHVNMQQRSEANASFQVTVAVPLGSKALFVDGDATAVEDKAVTGKVVADAFRLDGLAAGLRTVLGPSQGNLHGEVAISGTVGAPRLNGSLEAWFRELTVSPLGLHRNELNFIVLFNGASLELIPVQWDAEPSLRAIQLAGGKKPEPARMELSFQMAFPTLDPKRVTLDAAIVLVDFPLFDRDDLRGRMEADITLSGTVDRPSIRGRAEVLELLVKPEFGGRTIRPLGLPADVTLVSGAPLPPLVEGEPASPFRTTADINIEAVIPRGTTRALGDLFEIYPHGKVVARTVDGELGLYGTIFAPRVGLNLYGRKFLLADDSRVIFSGDMNSDPALRITATYDISEVDLSPLGLETTTDSVVRVQVTGDVNDIRLVLSSDPPMDEANIISVVVLGTPVESGGATQGDAFRSQVANMVIGIATGGLRRLLTDQLPIDVFELDTEDGDLSRSRLTVGKRLAKNLLIRYRANLGAQLEDESVSEVAAEFKVGSFTIIGNYGDIGEFSVEASLRFRAQIKAVPNTRKRKDRVITPDSELQIGPLPESNPEADQPLDTPPVSAPK